MQPTTYGYDALGNLLSVQQIGAGTEQCGGTNPNATCTQNRSFQYDSLSRLKEATNPESGTIKYTYDANGNLQTKRDPRGIKTVYEYDGLNRLIKRCYKNIGTAAPLGSTTCTNLETGEPNTPDAFYTYENTTVTSLKGVLTKVTNGFSTTEYTGFDSLGRVTQSRQTTDGITYNPIKYSYYLSGALMEETYPSGRAVRYQLNNGGELTSVTSKKTASGRFWNYAANLTYTAAGAVSSMQLGNLNWESTEFNSRLQLEQIALGTTQNATNLLKLNYNYGTTDNNGNVKSQTITVPAAGTAPAFTAIQTYTYDSLNRLKQADEKPSGYTQAQCDSNPTQCWKQTYNYDRFGNRRFDETAGATTTLSRGCQTSSENPYGICDQQKNNPQITVSNSRLQGYVYDNAGNMTTDAEGKQFTYDGENKQTEVKTSLNQSLGKYFYDADGRRIKKEASEQGIWVTTIFVYEAMGKLVAEYSTTPAQAPYAKVDYLTNDHLGTPRILTDKNGNVKSRRDFLPFGEEIGVTTSQTTGRNSHPQYVGDTTRQKFTGQQRDAESSLDYFNARYFSSFHGRFTSVDPAIASAKTTSPQSWNRYAYCINNPLKLVDPSGMIWGQAAGDSRVRWFDTEDEMKTAGYEAVASFYYEVNGIWYSLNPNANEWRSFVTEEAAKWQYFKFTNYNGYGRIPLFNNLLNYLANVKTGNFEGALYDFAAGSFEVATLPAAGESFAASGLKEVAETGVESLADDLLANADEAYEIIDGVRRSKAAELVGNKTIRAEIKDEAGNIITKDIPIEKLHSPNKDSINVGPQTAMDRWLNTYNQTKSGSQPPPILVQPGNKGPKIKDVGFSLDY